MSPLWAFILWQLSLSLFAFFWGGCPCCTCDIFDDLFTRANSTDIGSNWSEDAGDWQIATNKLQSPASAFALATYTGDASNATVHAQVAVRTTSAGDKVRLVVGCTGTGDYFCGELKFGTGVTAANTTLKIFQRSGGTDTELATATIKGTAPNLDATIRLCVGTDGTIYFGLGTNIGIVADRCGVGAGSVGLATGDTAAGTITFDTFALDKSEGSCLYCCRGCSGESPLAWDVTLPALTNGTCASCSSHSSQTYRISRCQASAIPGVTIGDCYWKNWALTPCNGVNGFGLLLRFLNPAGDWQVRLSLGDKFVDHPCGVATQIVWQDTFTADPIDCATTYVLPRASGEDSGGEPCDEVSGNSATIVPVF